MTKVPSPASLGRPVRPRSRVLFPPAAEPSLQTLLRQLDLAPRPGPPNDGRPSSVRFTSLLQSAPVAADVVREWREALDLEVSLTPAEATLFEWTFCWDPEAVQAALPKKFDYLKTVHISRQRTAIALYDYARATNWRRPVLYVAALRIARAYLRNVVANESMTKDNRRDFTGRLGVSTVLMSRFIPPPAEELVEAVESISRSIAQGNEDETAWEYLLEAQVALFDLKRDRETLRDAALLTKNRFRHGLTCEVYIGMVDVALRLGDPSLLDLDGFDELPDRLHKLDKLSSLPVEVALRVQLTRALLIETMKRGVPFSATGYPSLPFGLRNPGGDSEFSSFVPIMLQALSSSHLSFHPLARSLAADLLEREHGTTEATEEQLRERIRLRSFWGPQDDDDRNTMLRLRDELLLAAALEDSSIRARCLGQLLALADGRASIAASALVLVARDIEVNGACPQLKLPGSTANSIRAGLTDALFLQAAAAAERSPDLFLTDLGGRSNVTTVGDLYNVIGETFIFKEVYLEAFEKEQLRVARLLERLQQDGLEGKFCVTPKKLLRKEESKSARGIAVRRFHRGTSVREYLILHPDQADSILRRVVAFLGWMNRVEGLSETQTGRREIRRGELNMWLKTLGHGDPSGFCDRWWDAAFDHAVGAPRRDAHLDNWILSVDGCLHAIDLEACRYRPLGYELAVLTEDSAQLAPDNWSIREHLLSEYEVALGRPAVSGEDLRRPYEASVLARAVRHLTMPRDDGRYVRHGLGVLEHLRINATSPTLAEQSDEVLNTFLRTRGSVESFSRFAGMAPAERRRLSKRMAYLLRHSTSVVRDTGGWVALSEFAKRMEVPTAAIVEVACHVDEGRFEVTGDWVRARYGHSVPVEMEYQPAKLKSPLLFHGTSASAVKEILAQSGGIRRMQRRWVHLTPEVADAYAAAERKGDPIVLGVVAEGLGVLWSASESTILTPYVPPGLARVVPISFMWEQVPRCAQNPGA